MLECAAARISATEIAGFVFAPADPDQRFVVELLLDGYPVRIARAHLYDKSLAAHGYGDGCYRFVFVLDAEVVAGARIAEVKLANLGQPIGLPIELDAPFPKPEVLVGRVQWQGGLRLTGWVGLDIPQPILHVYIDGDCVAQTRADRFIHVGEAVVGGIARGFELCLPLTLADGRLRRVQVRTQDDIELEGSPCPVLAFPRGLEDFLESRADLGSHRLKAQLFDRLLPQSLPFSQYAAWCEMFPLPKTSATGRIAVVIVGGEGLADTLSSLEMQGAQTVAVLPAGESAVSFAPQDLATVLDHDIFVFAPSGVRFAPCALAKLSEALVAAPLAYSDITWTDAHGQAWPLAFSAFDYERLLEQGYAALVFAARVDPVREALQKGAADLFRLFNAAFDEKRCSVAHVPGFLAQLPFADFTRLTPILAAATQAHLEARGVNTIVEPRASDLLPRVRVRRIPPRGSVSILIPTRNRVDLLRPCLQSLQRTLTAVDHEIILLDNDTQDPETLAFFEEIAATGVRIAPVRGVFNFSRLINAGASIARGEFLLLLNNDVEALQDGWLEEMLSRIAEPDVGVVGAKLLFPQGGIQHGGIVLGPNLAAAHAFQDLPETEAGYGELLRVAHETSAVTAACMLTPRRLFRDLGGLDAVRYRVLFNDVDYCLRVRAAGQRVVMTPHIALCHHAGASRSAGPPHRHELDALRATWAEVLAEDPFYSPLLALDDPYAGLAWPPRIAVAK